MCVVSMIGDHYRDIWKDQPWLNPGWPKDPIISPTNNPIPPSVTKVEPAITRQEFDELKRQVDEMVKLLKRAKIYDEENNQPECEIAEKMELLKNIAKLVGVDLDQALAKGNNT